MTSDTVVDNDNTVYYVVPMVYYMDEYAFDLLVQKLPYLDKVLHDIYVTNSTWILGSHNFQLCTSNSRQK